MEGSLWESDRFEACAEMNFMKTNHEKLLFLFSLIFIFIFFWKVPLQTQDGPNHKKVAVILSRLTESPQEASVYQSRFGILQTNSLFPLLYQGVSKKNSVQTYEKTFVLFFLILLILSFRYFLSVWAPEHSLLWVVILPFCFHPLFMRGMYNFMASVPLTLLAATLLRQGIKKGSARFLFAFAVCCWLALLAHPFSFLALPLVLGLLFFGEFQKKWVLCGFYGLIILAFLIPGFIEPLIHTPPSVNTPYNFSPFPVILGGLYVFNFMDYSKWNLLAMLPFFCTLVWLATRSARTLGFQKWIWISFLLGYALLPRGGNGGGHINERFLIYALCFLPYKLPILSKNSLRWIQRVSVLTFFISAFFVFWGMKIIDASYKNTQRVLEKLPDQARLYPINFNLKGSSLINDNLTHHWAAYDDKKVIYSPYLFAFRDLMPLSRKLQSSETYFPATEEGLPEKIARGSLCKPRSPVETQDCSMILSRTFHEIFQKASYYDYWLVSEPTPTFSEFLKSLPGLEKISESQNVTLWHYQKAKMFNPPLP